MASSRKRKRADPAEWDLLPRLRAQLADVIPSRSRVVVALSGGVDSVVLLDVLRRFVARRRVSLSALHVDHQLQAQSAEWAKFCRRSCRAAGIPLRVTKVRVHKRNSVERAARVARYQALLGARADFVALAHNADDQAETVLLHLLRGAGIRGLAGMRSVGEPPVSLSGDARQRVPLMLRPLLEVPRSAIMRYAQHRKLEWIDDPSNASVDFTRNYLRREVLPRVAQRFPAYRDALTRAARHAAEAAALLDEFGQRDMAEAERAGGLSAAALRAVSRSRAKNMLRLLLARHGIEVPSAERLEEAVRQIVGSRAGSRVTIDLGARQLRLHGGKLAVIARPTRRRAASRVWRGESTIELPEFGGTLQMRRTRGDGISEARLAAGTVTLRARSGGERLKLHASGPTRTVKNLMQEARMPAWERERVPFLFCNDDLVCVPGLAIASDYRAAGGESALLPVWEPEGMAAASA